MSIEVRPYRPGDEEAILACWNDIFPTADRAIAPRGPETFRWYFLENPVGGEPRIMLAWEGDRVVGQYAGCPIRALLEGRGEAVVVQAVDLMVRPSHRRMNLPDGGDQVVHFTDLVKRGWRAPRRRPGLFVHLGRRYYERYCGPDKDLMTYGYAVPAWRIGNRFLGYEMVEGTMVLFRELQAAGFTPAPATVGGVTVAEAEEFGAEVDGLWRRCAPELSFALVRDRAYLEWRYRDHPEHSYRIFKARDGEGRLRGLALYRRGDFIIPGAGLVVDWLVPGDEEEAAAALLGSLEQAALAEGCPVLAALFPSRSPWFLRFQRRGYLVRGTEYILGVVTFYRTADWLRERWYYTLGDSDLA